MASYKELKEQFVTGFSGSTKLDIGIICFFLPLSLLLSSLIHNKPSLTYNFFLLVLPITLSVCWTDFTEHKLLIIIILGSFYRKSLVNPFTNKRPAFTYYNSICRYDFITYYRSLLLIATCVSILAVDFKIYPRRFVKTEIKGVSLMDIGTGCVLFSSAFVARHTRGEQKITQRIPGAFMACLPLLVIGIGKFFAHTAVDYQEHVSEYGVHWNFFMSLGVVVLFSAVITLKKAQALILAGIVMTSYEIALRNGLEEYILNAPRDSFFSMNREGICGCIGFFCIYQIGVGIKDFILVKDKEFANMVKFFVVFSLLSAVVGNESRRLNNLGYVLWVVAHNLFCMISVWVVERMSKDQLRNTIIDAINYNQLPYFMLSNLLTGAVNLSVQTIFTEDVLAFGIICLYMFIACAAMWALQVNKIKIKRW